MKKRTNLLERMLSATDLDAALQPRLPLVEIAGCSRLLVENHKSVIAYSPQQVCIKVNYGHIRVTGNALDLAKMGKDQLVITGCIECVQLCRRSK